MARRRRRSGASGSLGALVLVILTVLLAYRKEPVLLAILWSFAFVLWLAFFKKTACDVEKDNGEGCGNTTYGRLRACHLTKHRRAKHDALWAMFGVKNPAAKYRIMWAKSRSSYGRVSPQPQAPPARLMRPVYDGTMLVATVVAALVAVITFAFQVRSF
jgi:Ca2+/Na+ antiporter